MGLICYSVNFTTAELAVREKVAFCPEGRWRKLDLFKLADKAIEALILRKCNRTEMYIYLPDHLNPEQLVAKAVFNGMPAAGDQLVGSLFLSSSVKKAKL